MGLPGLTRTQAEKRFAPRSLVTATVLRAFGHSYVYGSTTSTLPPAIIGVSDFVTLVAALLGLPQDNQGVSGASLGDMASTGDVGDIEQYEVRGSTAFEPTGGASVLMPGLNDAAQVGHTYSALASFKSALRVAVARLRASAVFEDSHSSVSFTGSWSTTTISTRNSGVSVRYTSTNGDSVAFAPPAGFPGGVLTIPLIAWGDGGSCTWTAVVNGITYTVNTADYARTGNHPTVGLMRIPNVKRTNGPITFTVSNIVGGAAPAVFDCVMWEPPEASCAVVALVGQPKPLDYTSQAAAPAGPVTDAGVDVINQILAEVAAEFGPRAIYVDTSSLDHRADCFEAGNVHPSALGHALIAALINTAIRAVVGVVPSRTAPPPSTTPISYTPTLTGTGGTTLGAGTATGTYRDVGNGDREVIATITAAADTVIGSTTYISLPSNEVTGTIQIGRAEAYIFRSSGTNPGYYPIVAHLGASSGKAILRQATLDANGRWQSITAAAPLALTAGDKIYLSLTYRAS